VIIPVVLPRALAALRNAGDQKAARGVPAHVTVLFPFLPADALTPDVQSALANLSAETQPFVARFGQVARRGQMVWLVPFDQGPFLRLTAAVQRLWPDYPPYEGLHDELLAHLTLIETGDESAIEAACTTATECGPFEVRVRGLTVITERDAGEWRTRWRLSFGPAPGQHGLDT
jgi:2'-5' RNA ligase